MIQPKYRLYSYKLGPREGVLEHDMKMFLFPP
jgi:hypothetical protein